jgi:hypothetical protein
MTMTLPDDHAQAVLLRKLQELYPDLKRDILLNCYRIEKEHQFDNEPEMALARLRTLISSALNDEPNPLSSRQPGRQSK